MRERVEVSAAGECGMRMRHHQKRGCGRRARVCVCIRVIRQPPRALTDHVEQKRKRRAEEEEEEQGADRKTAR